MISLSHTDLLRRAKEQFGEPAPFLLSVAYIMISEKDFSPGNFKQRDKESGTCVMIMNYIKTLKQGVNSREKGMKQSLKILASWYGNINKPDIPEFGFSVRIVNIRRTPVYGKADILVLCYP